MVELLPPQEEEEEEGDAIKVAVIGKPNVGKSSLVNKVAGENRCIVSDIAGTTRDAVDTTIQNEYGTFTFIDTAGLRRKSRVEDAIEHYSNLRAEMAVERADVCLILIDAQVGFTEQDSKVAGIAHEAGKGCVICVNKWDAVEKDTNTMAEMRKKLEEDFSFMFLRAHPVHLRQDRAAAGQDVPAHLPGGGQQRHAGDHRHPQRHSGPGHRPGAASHRQGPAAEDLLHDPGFYQAPYLRMLLQRPRALPLLLPAVFGEQDPGELWVGGHPRCGW